MHIFGGWVYVFLVISVHRNSYDTYVLSDGPILSEFDWALYTVKVSESIVMELLFVWKCVEYIVLLKIGWSREEK